MRGEYGYQYFHGFAEWELPPRARRIPWSQGEIADEAGTTSACAENTDLLKTGSVDLGNYLRVRGEYPGEILPQPIVGELPPRARRILDAGCDV